MREGGTDREGERRVRAGNGINGKGGKEREADRQKDGGREGG